MTNSQRRFAWIASGKALAMTIQTNRRILRVYTRIQTIHLRNDDLRDYFAQIYDSHSQ